MEKMSKLIRIQQRDLDALRVAVTLDKVDMMRQAQKKLVLDTSSSKQEIFHPLQYELLPQH